MDVGGVETNLVGLSRELQQRGHNVWVMSSGGVLEDALQEQGVEHLRSAIEIRNPMGLLKAAWRLRQFAKDQGFDVVHAMSAAANVVATMALGRKSTTVHLSSPMGLQNSDHEAGLVTDARNWLLAIGADRILLISKEIERAMRRLRVDADRMIDCRVVGVDCSRFRSSAARAGAIRAEFGIGPEEAIISTIGALHSRKSHHLFIQAASGIVRQQPNTRCLVVGEGPLWGELQQQIRQLDLEGRVILTGRRADVDAILAETDVYVKPGIVEGFIGITVLEAMACEKPVVAFTTVDVQAAIVDGLTGMLVPPGDAEALASAVLQLLSDRPLAARLARNGLALVERQFDLPAVASGLEGIYERVLADKRRLVAA